MDICVFYSLCYKCTCIYIFKRTKLTQMYIIGLLSKRSNVPFILVIVTVVHNCLLSKYMFPYIMYMHVIKQGTYAKYPMGNNVFILYK